MEFLYDTGDPVFCTVLPYEKIVLHLCFSGDDFPNAESLLEALFGLDETLTAMSAGATASTFASEDGNNSVYSNISTAASTASRSSGKCCYESHITSMLQLKINLIMISSKQH